jgi:hypothetical protein
MPNDLYALLQHQSLGRPLTDDEQALAAAIEKAFRSGVHDFNDIARALEQDGVKRPSGAVEQWTAQALEQELKTINASLDAAYTANGIGA